MKKKITFLLFAFYAILLCPMHIFSQDLIKKRNGDEIISKVLEINPSEVKYKKYDNQDGPTYTILISEVSSIKYQNGTEELFKIENESTRITEPEANKFDHTNRTLILENTKSKKRILFKENQYINVKYKAKGGYIIQATGFLADIGKDYLIIGSEKIQLTDIYSIFYVRKSRNVLSIAGSITTGVWAGAWAFTGVFYDGLIFTAGGLYLASYLIKRNIVLGEKFILKIEE